MNNILKNRCIIKQKIERLYSLNKDLFKNYDLISLSLIGFGFFLSLYSLYFFISNKYYLIGSDAFFYMSVADSLIQNGEMKDIVQIPSALLRTPQNGIVFIHALLSLLGLSNNQHVIPIVFLNYFLYLSGIYPLFRIAKKSGMKNGLPLSALLAVYLGAWHIYRINLLVLNDGIFNSMTLWLIFLIIEYVFSNNISEQVFLSRPDLSKLFGIFFLVILSVLFRVNAGLIIGSAIVGSILVRNYKAAIWFVIACIFLLISFYTVVSLIEMSKSLPPHGYVIRLFKKTVDIYGLKGILWSILPRLVAALSPLSNFIATLFFALFPISMIYFLVKGFFERNFAKVFIGLICLSGLWFTLAHFNARNIWYTFPFIYLILLSIKRIRLIGYAFVLLVFVQSLQQFYIGFKRNPSSELFLHIYENRISLPDDDPLLLTRRARHSYFHFGIGSYRVADDDDGSLDGHITFPKELNWSLIKEKGSLFVLGDSLYIKSTCSQVKQMAELNGYNLESSFITPDLDEFKGWGLVELSIYEKLK